MINRDLTSRPGAMGMAEETDGEGEEEEEWDTVLDKDTVDLQMKQSLMFQKKHLWKMR